MCVLGFLVWNKGSRFWRKYLVFFFCCWCIGVGKFKVIISEGCLFMFNCSGVGCVWGGFLIWLELVGCYYYYFLMGFVWFFLVGIRKGFLLFFWWDIVFFGVVKGLSNGFINGYLISLILKGGIYRWVVCMWFVRRDFYLFLSFEVFTFIC